LLELVKTRQSAPWGNTRTHLSPPISAPPSSLYAGRLFVAYSFRGRTPARWVNSAPRRLLPAGWQLCCRDRIFATPPPGYSICTSAVSQSPQKTACKPRPPAGSTRRPRGCLTPVVTTKGKTLHQESAET